MSNLNVDQQLENANQSFGLLLSYFVIIVLAMSGYFKLFSNWRAAAVIAPAVVMYVYGTRTLNKAIASIKESTK